MTSREAKYNVWAGKKLDLCVMEHSCMYLFNILIIFECIWRGLIDMIDCIYLLFILYMLWSGIDMEAIRNANSPWTSHDLDSFCALSHDFMLFFIFYLIVAF